MKQVNGIWFTGLEKHLAEFKEVKENGTYQKATLDLALSHCDKFRNAIDIGGHVGLWSMHLVKKFDCVHIFEPILDHIDCLVRNVQEGTYHLNMCALGEEEKDGWMQLDPENTGHTHVAEEGTHSTKIKTLDSFNLKEIDFIKMDCEGYEVFVCKGGKETLLREKPVICIEQKPHGFYSDNPMAGVEYLNSLGFEEVGRIRKDIIMKHKEAINGKTD